jgi:carbon storage regulator CsrA
VELADRFSRGSWHDAAVKEEYTMLVLSRKVGERIVIDEHITLVVNSISGNRVTLGIEAPKEVDIKRGEIVNP